MEVTVVGSINTDIICYADRFPKPGETIVGTSFSTGFGGKGANQCVAVRKLGGNTSLVSRVGADQFGDDYVKYLHQLGVGTGAIKVSNTAKSGVAVITVEHSHGNNSIVVIPGANDEVSIDDVEEAKSKNLISKSVILCQFEANAEASLYALEMAKGDGATTILDPAPAPKPDSPFFPLLKRFMAAATIICPNETEAGVLTGISLPDLKSRNSHQIIEETLQCLLHLHDAGVLYPLITLGSNGVVGLLPKSESKSAHSQDVVIVQSDKIVDDLAAFHLKCPATTVVDSTGAGDCFAGTLAFFMARYPGMTLVEKMRRSIWIASQSVLRHGTQVSFYKNKELPEELFQNREFHWPST